MILTQELWEEYTAAVPNELNWEELMDAGLTAQACAAANATNWKLEQVLEDNQLLRIQNAELSAAMEIYARTEVKLVRQQNTKLVEALRCFLALETPHTWLYKRNKAEALVKESLSTELFNELQSNRG